MAQRGSLSKSRQGEGHDKTAESSSSWMSQIGSSSHNQSRETIDTQKNKQTSSSSSPFKSFSSIRKIPSQLFSAFTPGRKRKTATTITEQESPSSPSSSSKKRARIIAPESLGSEQSRQLIELLDRPDQPNYNQRKMLEDLERQRRVELDTAALIKKSPSSRDQDPHEEVMDDDEVDQSLSLLDGDGYDDNHAGSSKLATSSSASPSRKSATPNRDSRDKGKARIIDRDETSPLLEPLDEQEVLNSNDESSLPSLAIEQPLSSAQFPAQVDTEDVSHDARDHVSNDATTIGLSPALNGRDPDRISPANKVESSETERQSPPKENGSTELSGSAIDDGNSQISKSHLDDGNSGVAESHLNTGTSQLSKSPINDGTTEVSKAPMDDGASQISDLPIQDAADTSLEHTLTADALIQQIQESVMPSSEPDLTGESSGLNCANGQVKEIPATSNGEKSGEKTSGMAEGSIHGVADTTSKGADALERSNGEPNGVHPAPIELQTISAEDQEPQGNAITPLVASDLLGSGFLYPALPQATSLSLPDSSEAVDEKVEVPHEQANAQPNSVDANRQGHSTSADALTEDVTPIEAEVLESEQAAIHHNDDEEEGSGSEDSSSSDDSESTSDGDGSSSGDRSDSSSEEDSDASSHRVSNNEEHSSIRPAVARSTLELGEAEDVVDEPTVPPAAVTAQAPTRGPPAGVVDVIDFTGDDSDDDEEEAIIIQCKAQIAPVVARQPSSGLLRGPLSLAQTHGPSSQSRSVPSRIPVPSRSTRPVGDASSIIQAMGRASLASPRPPSDVSMTDMFTNQRYTRPQSKRRDILHNEHKAKVKARNQAGVSQLKDLYQQHATSLRDAGFTNAAAFGDYMKYRSLVTGITYSDAPPKARAMAMKTLSNVESMEQRQFRLFLGKTRAVDSRTPIKPGKEQRRLRREQQLKERRRRGILGRPLLPLGLSPEQESVVRTILSDPGWKASIPGASASYHDIIKLRPGQWMNDETITFYMTMINQRSIQAEQERSKPGYNKRKWDAFYRVHAFNSHFWAKLQDSGYTSVSRWTRRVNIFEKDLILIPCNLGNSHWTCAAINFRRKRFEYYDSMAGSNTRLLSHLREYVKKEVVDKKKVGAVDLNEFTDYFASDTSPQQRNTFDCGVFVCATLEQLSRRDPHYPFNEDPPPLEPLEDDDEDEDDQENILNKGGISKDGYEWNFGQKNMPYLRKRIIYEISQKSLLE
ncbi:unnamed protein product [Sympodiomycopsis kandeliae]